MCRISCQTETGTPAFLNLNLHRSHYPLPLSWVGPLVFHNGQVNVVDADVIEQGTVTGSDVFPVLGF